MTKVAFCSSCGSGNKASNIRCAQCGVIIRPIYPTAASILALLGVYALWLLYVQKVLPIFATILSDHGAKFHPYVRFAMGVGQYFTGWGILVGVLFLPVLFWLGISWKPQRSIGANLVVTLALLKGVSILLFVVLSVLDVLPFIKAG